MAPNNANCCECKLVSKDGFTCEKCKRIYHIACWPKRMVKNEENNQILGCTICIKKAKSENSKKRKGDELMRIELENESESDMQEWTKMFKSLLIGNNAVLKNCLIDMIVENTEKIEDDMNALKNEIEK